MKGSLLRTLSRGRRILTAAAAPGDGRADDAAPLLDELQLRELQRLSLQSGRAVTEWLMGEHPGIRKTQGLEFSDYRGYVPGDDFRQIDWHAYARLGELVVKTAQTQEVMTLTLLLDCSRSMDWGTPNKLRYAKRLAALTGALALLQSDLVRLCSLGDGDAHAGALLSGAGALHVLVEELERFPVAGSTDLQRSLEAVHQSVAPRGLVLLLSDMLIPAPQFEALRSLASAETVVTVLHLVDDRESLPSMNGAVTLRDSESGDQLLLPLSSALRRRYLDRFEAHAQELAAYCAAHGATYLRINTAVPPVDVLAGLFRAEGMVEA